MTFISVLNFFTRVNSECSRFSGYCIKEQRRIQNLAKHLRWSFSRKQLKYLKTPTIFAITFILDVWLGLNTPLKSICSRKTQKSNL